MNPKKTILKISIALVLTAVIGLNSFGVKSSEDSVNVKLKNVFELNSANAEDCIIIADMKETFFGNRCKRKVGYYCIVCY